MSTNVTYYKGNCRCVKSLNMLRVDNDMTTGQCFWAVADYYGKTKEDYPRWISFKKHRGEFDVINSIVQEAECDLDKLNIVCNWLGEEPIS